MVPSIKKAFKTVKPIGRLFIPNVKTLVLIYALLLLLVLRSHIDSFLFNHFGSSLSYFHSLLSNNCLINWATTIFLIIVSAVLLKRHYDKNKQYGWTLIISLFFILYLLKDDSWAWVLTPIGISYKVLLIAILLAFFSCGCLHLWQLIKNTPCAAEDDKKNKIGFAVTTTQESLQETGWQPYVENLVSKLLETDLSNESFAVGVSGVWGS